MDTEINELKQAEKEHINIEFDDPVELKEAEKNTTSERKKKTRNSGSGWCLVAVGVFLLLAINGFGLNNWWALFILIPAAKSLERRDYGGAMLMALIASIFLFNLSWSYFLPLLLIGWGMTALMKTVRA